MVAFKHLGVTTALWLSLASRGLAQSINDEAEGLALRGNNIEQPLVRDVELDLGERDEEDELEARDIGEYLETRGHHPLPPRPPKPGPRKKN